MTTTELTIIQKINKPYAWYVKKGIIREPKCTGCRNGLTPLWMTFPDLHPFAHAASEFIPKAFTTPLERRKYWMGGYDFWWLDKANNDEELTLCKSCAAKFTKMSQSICEITAEKAAQALFETAREHLVREFGQDIAADLLTESMIPIFKNHMEDSSLFHLSFVDYRGDGVGFRLYEAFAEETERTYAYASTKTKKGVIAPKTHYGASSRFTRKDILEARFYLSEYFDLAAANAYVISQEQTTVKERRARVKSRNKTNPNPKNR